MRVADLGTTKRKLSPATRTFLEYWLQWSEAPVFPRRLSVPVPMQGLVAAADAMAAGSSIGVGGFLKFEGSPAVWFSERFSPADFLPFAAVADDAQKDIACYELFGQMILLWIFAQRAGQHSFLLALRTLCDNTGAEATGNRLYTGKFPLASFAQRLSLLAWHTHTELRISHVPGVLNDDADLLSRWDQISDLPSTWDPDFRIRVTVPEVWNFKMDVRVWPHNTRLKWQRPSALMGR